MYVIGRPGPWSRQRRRSPARRLVTPPYTSIGTMCIPAGERAGPGHPGDALSEGPRTLILLPMTPGPTSPVPPEPPRTGGAAREDP